LENRDCYPPAVLDSVNWKYWDMDAIWQYAMGTSPTAQMNYYTNYKTFIFCCPSSDKSRSASYGINVMFPAGVKNYYEPRKRAAVANPAFCLLLGEGVNHAIDSWWASSPPGQPVSFPHGGAMNLLFMDLHMETRKPSEIPKGGWSSPESTDPFWTGH